MSKGLRLGFYGVTCSVEEVKVMTHSLGFDSYPIYNGWGSGGYRNFFGCNRNIKDNNFLACESLVAKGLMTSREAPGPGTNVMFHVSKFGKAWHKAFRHKHPHADWGEHAF
jgi:hypothetical protein